MRASSLATARGRPGPVPFTSRRPGVKHTSFTRIPNAAAVQLPEAPQLDAPAFCSLPGHTDEQGRLLLKNLTLPQLEEYMVYMGEQQRRGEQLWRWMYGDNRWIRNFSDPDTQPQKGQPFSGKFKTMMGGAASLSGGMTLQSVHEARDGTQKLVFALNPAEGTASGTVETVLIPMYTKGGDKRYTACVSTQVGCAMNCQFCYTGRMGLLGNLTTAQIVEQVVEARRLQAAEGRGHRVHNVVFMGMGEPLHNLAAVEAALEVMCDGHAHGLHLGRSKVIVSTVGLVPEMRRFVARGVGKLAVSLHATTDEVRNWIVPTNRRYPLAELLGALREMYPIESKKGDEFVIIEYTLLRGVNDTPEDAHRLAELLKPIYCMVNLISFNPHAGTHFQRSSDDDARQFQRILQAAGKVTKLRLSKGDDEMAACGQLGDPQQSPRPVAPAKPPPEYLANLMAAAQPAAQAAAAAAGSEL